jgi:hypothetical protein
MKITVYRTRNCPKCIMVEVFIREQLGIDVALESICLDTPEGMTEARCRGVFSLEAPVLQIDDTLIVMPQTIFKGDNLDRKGLLQLLEMA